MMVNNNKTLLPKSLKSGSSFSVSLIAHCSLLWVVNPEKFCYTMHLSDHFCLAPKVNLYVK